MTDVSPKQGHASFVPPSVITAPAHSLHNGSPILYSQYRGPHIYNMAETDDEKAKREEEERKAKEDEEKRSNFDKVRLKAEREEEARKKAEAERDALLEEKRQREEAEKKAAEEKLAQEKRFEELAKQKEAEAAAKAAEAEAAAKRAEAAESKLKAIEEQQEKELTAILDTIPEDKRPPLDENDPVEKRLAQVKYAQSLLNVGPKPQVGAGARKGEGNGDRLKELLEAEKKRPLTQEETFELMSLSGE